MFISYELAKALKEAGFSQKTEHYWNFNRAVPKQGWYLDDENLAYPKEDTIACPTLSELIDACGENFGALIWDYRDKKWYAVNNDKTAVIREEADSKEVATALLYLKLKLNERTKYKRKNQTSTKKASRE